MATATPTIDLGVTFGIPALAGKQFPAKGLTDPGVPEIISNYVFRLPLLRKALIWMDGKAGRSIYLAGPSGSGKTSLAEQMAARLGWICTTLSCNVRTERADIVGYMGLENGSTRFIPGPLVRAMRNGEMIVFDEGDALPPSITITLNRVLEGSPLVIPETGEVIHPHKDFRIAFTGNTRGRGDETGTHRASNVQDAAVLDRFLFLEVGYPTQEEENDILVGKFGTALPDEIREILLKTAQESRAAFIGGELSAPISTRGLVRISELVKSGIFSATNEPLWEAVCFGFADGLSEGEKSGLRSIMKLG